MWPWTWAQCAGSAERWVQKSPWKRKWRPFASDVRSRRCRLIAVAIELGGRWSDETAAFFQLLAGSLARSARTRCQHLCQWSPVRYFAGSILSLPPTLSAMHRSSATSSWIPPNRPSLPAAYRSVCPGLEVSTAVRA